MIETILVPTDGSERAKPAIDYALQLAEVHGADVHALYVVETEASYILTVGIDDEAKEEHRAYGEEKVTEIVEELERRDLTGKGAVRTGKVAEEIVDYSGDKGIDHIVIGRQGRGAVEQYLGSTAEKVVRMSEVPVTVVRTTTR